MKLLIVDDSVLLQERLIAMLSEVEGIGGVTGASNGDDGLAAIRTAEFDAVILDIRMEGKSGIEVLKEIKEERPSIVVIMLTNYPYAQCRKKCTSAGADFFFDKSTEFEKVIEVLAALARTCIKTVVKGPRFDAAL